MGIDFQSLEYRGCLSDVSQINGFIERIRNTKFFSAENSKRLDMACFSTLIFQELDSEYIPNFSSTLTINMGKKCISFWPRKATRFKHCSDLNPLVLIIEKNSALRNVKDALVRLPNYNPWPVYIPFDHLSSDQIIEAYTVVLNAIGYERVIECSWDIACIIPSEGVDTGEIYNQAARLQLPADSYTLSMMCKLKSIYHLEQLIPLCGKDDEVWYPLGRTLSKIGRP